MLEIQGLGMVASLGQKRRANGQIFGPKTFDRKGAQRPINA